LEALPPIEKRLASPELRISPSSQPDIYKKMRDDAENGFWRGGGGGGGSVGPLFLICGNVQQFRLDLVQDAIRNWRP
jgi:hypothetical protein